ncbi:sel1 repeat family protein [Sphingomonas panacisoli]|uniref:Sel1 repeat family protein n=1 Tax=Sphingomonas panacisoli TaxID=1813879 RepID=A0A5B8LKZ0_9SPHN|nr:sel1 repeat family protein [Sphingomonas panacisoli]QDZ08878.1 sel1 repeat family protein [Sphingomonas panacisoli]
MGSSLKSAQFLIESRLRDAARGNWDACYDLGVDYSAGVNGVEIDLVEAHKWFNIAASRGGHESARYCRAEVADEMTAREIAEAQTRARAWLSETSRRAA